MATREACGSFEIFNTCSYLHRAGSAITVGISMFGAAPPKALNCSGFRNMTEHCEQA